MARLAIVGWLVAATALASEPLRLTTDGDFKQHLRWSPDGTTLLVTRHHAGLAALWLYDADGTNPRRLLPTVATPHFDGSYSADGKRIVYVLDKPKNNDGEFQINLCGADGSGDRVAIPHKAFEESPVLSPDGRTVVWMSTRDKNPELYAADLDGKNIRRLTNEIADDIAPAWSPDGKSPAFVSARSGQFEIWRALADGSQPRRLTEAKVLHARPVWSPDGQRLAFTSYRDGNADVFAMTADGSAPVNLTRHPKRDYDPAWSPDGKRIAFPSTRAGGHDVFVLDVPAVNEK